MSISIRNESNLNSNQMTNSTQLNELSSSDSNNNNEESESFNLAELETINKYKESLAITSMHQGVPGLGILSPQDGQGRATRVMRRCTTDENSLALHNHNGLEGKKKLSVVLIALVDQLAAAYEEDEERRKLFSQEICKSLIKLDLIHPTFLLQQMEGLRAQYSVAFQKLVHIARDKLPRNRNTLPALLGPDHRLAVSVIKLHNLYKLSRYKEEFIEEGKLGHGGFGVVYRAKNKLDNATYAVKKVFVKISKEELVLKIFREVTVFARVSHSNIVGYKNAWLEPCVMNTSDGLVNSNSSNASGSSPSSPVIESESPSSGQQEDPDSFSIQFAAEVSNNNKQNQYQFHYIRSAHNSLQNGKVVSEMSNIITSENRNIVFDTNEPNDDLNVEKEDSLLQRGIGVPHINKQTKKAKVQILEELNGTPPEWSEMERVIGLPRRLSDTNNTSFDFQNSLFLQEAVNRSRGGKIRLAADATNSSMNRKSKFWLGAGDTNSSQLISEPPSDSNFVDSDSDNCKAVISFKTREALKPQLQLECAVLYIQMDLCSQTLREWLDERNESERQIDENECFPIFQQLLQAVAYLHEEKGILHRDIKPRNIFINPGLQVKLGDFGLAKDDLLRSATPQSTTPVDILHQAAFSPSTAPMDHTLGVGTQGYASPEQLTSSRVTQYSDMYSLGIVLFELYTKFGTNMERVDALTHLREKGITNIGTETNERILSLVSSLMNPVPELRPSARQLLQGYFSDCQLEKLERQQLTEEISALKLERDSLQNSLDIITKAKDTECASQQITLERQLQQMRALQEDVLVRDAEIQKMREQVTRQGAELADKTSLLNSKETEILYLRKLLKECGGRDPRI